MPEGEIPTEGGIPLILGKKGAFGSGEHETTVACLEELAALEIGGKSALDLGSGTGILAIAAVLLGAARAVALDNDPAADLSCRINLRLNNLEEVITPICGELPLLAGERFDILLANIYADIHLLLADSMVDAVSPGGFMILSGIPLQDKYDIWRRFTTLGMEPITSRIGEEYATYLMRKPVL